MYWKMSLHLPWIHNSHLYQNSIWRDCITDYIQLPANDSCMSIHLNAFIKWLSNFGLQQLGIHSFIEIFVYVLVTVPDYKYNIIDTILNIHILCLNIVLKWEPAEILDLTLNVGEDCQAILCFICNWRHGSLHVYSLFGCLVRGSSGVSGWWILLFFLWGCKPLQLLQSFL